MIHINMSDDDTESDIASVSSVASQPVIPPLFLFALNPAHAMQGVINSVKSDNVKLHKKGTSQLLLVEFFPLSTTVVST